MSDTETAGTESRDALFDRLRSEPFEPSDERRIAEELARRSETDGTAPAAEPLDASPVAPVAPPVIATYDDRPPVLSLPLDYPLTVDGLRYDRLELRHPSVAAVRRVLNGESAADDLFAEMAGVPVAVLLALRWPDAERFTVNARLIAPEMART